jgi:hypothetical protein
MGPDQIGVKISSKLEELRCSGALLQILGLNVRKKGIALMAAGDLVGDDLDTILDQYRSEFQLSLFVSFGGNLIHGKSIQ